ncbi:MAG: hypothetical protein IJ932_03055 [Ruminococcus sp.]|nr:hypothetical protein [Ruminococcus sp.]
MDRRYTVFRYLAYSLELLLLFILQTTPRLLPEFFGSKPLLLLPAAITISFFESEIPSMFFGLASGLLLDFGYSDNVGFFTITLTLSCFFIGLIFRDYLVISFLNATVFIVMFCTSLLILHFMFSYVFAGKGDVFYYFSHHIISRIVYTFVCGILLYFLNKFLYKNLRDS